MKVYVKKGEKPPIFFGIFAIMWFLMFAFLGFNGVFNNEMPFSTALALHGDAFVFSILFFGLGMFFIFYLLKRPKAYKAKLISKKIEIYDGKQITYMEFSAQKEKEQEEDFISPDYKCYTIGENNLVIGNYYALKIKEFNWKPRYVEELQINQEDEEKLKLTKNTKKEKVASKVPNTNLSIVSFIIAFSLIALILLCILELKLYPEYQTEYIVAIIFFAIALYRTFKVSKLWKRDNNIERNEDYYNLELKKVKPLDSNQKKVGNIVIKYYLIIFVFFAVAWFLIMMKMNITKEAFLPAYLLILSFVGVPIIVLILFNTGYDERLVKKHDVNIIENINIASMQTFNIFRPTKNITFPQYFIVDQNKNLILKIKKGSFFGNKYVICNQKNVKIGEIKLKVFSLTNEFIVNMVNEKPFIVRSKMQLHANYQVIGRDYYVKGDAQLIKNIIYDNKNNEIAYMSAVSKHNNNWHELGNTEIVLNNGINNNMDIMLIALCITMGNFKRYDR